MRIVPSKVLSIIAIVSSGVAFAAPGPPPPGVPPPVGTPIDGQITFLLVAAVAYGLYKVHQFKLNKKAPM